MVRGGEGGEGLENQAKMARSAIWLVYNFICKTQIVLTPAITILSASIRYVNGGKPSAIAYASELAVFNLFLYKHVPPSLPHTKTILNSIVSV